MNIKNFLSDHTYVLLPTKANPKVYLPIADSHTVSNAFELYNPFSSKAKILKQVAYFLCRFMKPLARIILPTVGGEKSSLVAFIEKELSKSITSAAYIATAKDKIVLQLQDKTGIIGYLKYPISTLGKERLRNEQMAIELLATKKIIAPLLLKGDFEGTPFILLQSINGEIGSVSKEEYTSVLKAFKKPERHLLLTHPRVVNLRKQLQNLQLGDLNNALGKTLEVSQKKYAVVYEHGDFAPWNLVRSKKGIIPFDFEYFEEIGLEHLDELKFHFQEQHLLHKKHGQSLIFAIATKVNIEEFDCLFHLFLLKEIVNKSKSQESVVLELSLLNQLTNN